MKHLVSGRAFPQHNTAEPQRDFWETLYNAIRMHILAGWKQTAVLFSWYAKQTGDL